MISAIAAVVCSSEQVGSAVLDTPAKTFSASQYSTKSFAALARAPIQVPTAPVAETLRKDRQPLASGSHTRIRRNPHAGIGDRTLRQVLPICMPRMLACADMSADPKDNVDSQLSHLDQHGRAHMVAVSDKPETRREARAVGRVLMQRTTLERIMSGDLPKGDVLQVARIAGIQAVKRTADLIPLCHPLRITSVKLEFSPTLVDDSAAERSIEISATVTAMDRTGVEMEALTAVSVAALTLYDMCKAVDRGMRITDIELAEKSGGRSGHYVAGTR